MRLWSLHPKYLDAKGLVALWRETLLAKHVLLGKTKGYKNHPQLLRFKKLKKPVQAIDQYLSVIYQTACDRGYNFDESKINWDFSKIKLKVTKGQIEFETKHLFNKLKKRDRAKYKELTKIPKLNPHPIFKIVKGAIEDWEIT